MMALHHYTVMELTFYLLHHREPIMYDPKSLVKIDPEKSPIKYLIGVLPTLMHTCQEFITVKHRKWCVSYLCVSTIAVRTYCGPQMRFIAQLMT